MEAQHKVFGLRLRSHVRCPIFHRPDSSTTYTHAGPRYCTVRELVASFVPDVGEGFEVVALWPSIHFDLMWLLNKGSIVRTFRQFERPIVIHYSAILEVQDMRGNHCLSSFVSERMPSLVMFNRESL